MKQFYDKEEYDFTDIDSLISNEVEESIYLDFKEAGALEKLIISGKIFQKMLLLLLILTEELSYMV